MEWEAWTQSEILFKKNSSFLLFFESIFHCIFFFVEKNGNFGKLRFLGRICCKKQIEGFFFDSAPPLIDRQNPHGVFFLRLGKRVGGGTEKLNFFSGFTV